MATRLASVHDIMALKSCCVKRYCDISSTPDSGCRCGLPHTSIEPLRDGIARLAESADQFLADAIAQYHRDHFANVVHPEASQLIHKPVKGILGLQSSS